MPRKPPIVETKYGSELHQATLEARDRILRQPLGMRLSGEDTEGEKRQRAFAVLEHDRLLAGLIIKPDSPRKVRLRQMWVEPELAGTGLGRHLVKEVLSKLTAEGIEDVVLHARQHVQAFYQKCGFVEDGPPFTELGIPHQRMCQTLSPEKQSPDCHR